MSWVRLRFLWLNGTAIGCRGVCLGFAWGSCGSVVQRLDVEVYVLCSLGVLVVQWYTIGCRSVCLMFAWGSCGLVVQRLDVEVYVLGSLGVLVAQWYSEWMSRSMSWVRLGFLWLSGTTIGCRSVCLMFARGSCGSVVQRLDVKVYVLCSLGVLVAQWYSDWMSRCMSWVRLGFLWLSGTTIGCRSVCLGFAWGSCGSVVQRLDVEVYILGSLGVLVAQWYSDWMSRCMFWVHLGFLLLSGTTNRMSWCMSWVRLGFLWLSGTAIGCRGVCLGFTWGSCGSVVQQIGCRGVCLGFAWGSCGSVVQQIGCRGVCLGFAWGSCGSVVQRLDVEVYVLGSLGVLVAH
ncbi:hypothetical protein Bpfe_029097 [Biomphalaria pfeifferi]|uniref:Uncharacterized protein n=1 Tax=Biomphalaria pfeifferi TaxID=112525 RepID=A0AAD8ATT1_BIOPF|nr:hypothetical protein Bpfe_029097 [Biomphalaria pfeifferi]